MKHDTKTALFLIPAAFLLALAGCTRTDLDTATTDGPRTLRVSAGGATKATGNLWDAGDEVGLILTAVSPTTLEDKYTSAYSHVGYKVPASDDGSTTTTFEAIDDGVVISNADAQLTFTAYGPYDSTLSDDNDYTVTASTSSQGTDSAQKTLDFIFAGEQTATWDNPVVTYGFSHKMVRVVLDVKPGEGLFDGDGNVDVSAIGDASFTLSGLVQSGTFNAKTGKAAAATSGSTGASIRPASGTVTTRALDSTPVSDWSLNTNAVRAEIKDDGSNPDKVTGYSFTFIAFPQEISSGLTLHTEIGGLDYDGTVTSPDGKLENGNTYTYSVAVNATALEVGACTITRWKDPDTDDWGTYGPYGSYVYIDDAFELVFNSSVTLGTSGYIKFYEIDSETNEVISAPIDYIDIADVVKENDSPTDMSSAYTFNTAMDALYAYPSDSQSVSYRPIHFKAVTVDPETNTATIRHHLGVFEHGKKYCITVDNTCFTAEGFEGIGKREWIVITKPAPSNSADVTVGQYGYDVDFRTVQGALCYSIGSNVDATPVSVTINEGTYTEFISVYGKKGGLTIKAAGDVVITEAQSGSAVGNSSTDANAPDGKPYFGQTDASLNGGRTTVYLGGCSDVELYDLTFENTYDKDNSSDGAADTFYFNSGSGTLVCIGCSFISEKNTVESKGYNWFYDCLIEGTSEYIWGVPTCSLFENCELRSVSTSSGSTANDVVCESRAATGVLGFCFLNCDLTASDDFESGSSRVYVGSTPTNSSSDYYHNMAVVNCVVKTERFYGWCTSSKVTEPLECTGLDTDGWKYYNFLQSDGETPYEIPEEGTTAYENGNWAYAYEIQEVEADDDADPPVAENKEYSAYFKDRTTIFSTHGGDESWYSTLEDKISGR